MKLLRITVALLVALFTAGSAAAQEETPSVRSPSGNVSAEVWTGEEGGLFYAVRYENKEAIQKSRLGFKLEDGALLNGNVEITGRDKQSVRDTWRPPYGQWDVIPNRYNELTVEVEETGSPLQRMRLTFRVYDAGVAFRYTFPEQEGLQRLTITDERTEFRFTGYHTAYTTYEPQGVYSQTTLNGIREGTEVPLTIETSTGQFYSVAEAAMIDYARANIRDAGNNAVAIQLTSDVTATGPFQTPWRVLFVGDEPTELLNNQHLILNLNKSTALGDPSWIKPGTVIRVNTLTTEASMRYVEFAEEHGLEYIHWDARWYGDLASDPAEPRPDLDVHEVIDAAHERDIGVIAYIDRTAMEQHDLEPMFSTLADWGIDGVKFGFVDVDSQQKIIWLHEAVKLAAQHDLMVNIHDRYRPTGFSRTYPNLMTQEGIRGDEEQQAPVVFLRTLYTRMLGGAADNTFCYYEPRVSGLWSHAFQLAKSVAFYSPWQYLYWYDSPDEYQGEPEIAFWDHLPATWDETRFTQGEIGKYATVARRNEDEWYVGTMTAQPRTLQVPLDFLEEDQWYVAHLYTNGDQPESRTNVRLAKYLVNSETVLRADLPKAGGQALRLVPASPQEVERYRKQKPEYYEEDIASGDG